ncbi:MAG: phosphorylase [Methylococcales bacterium]|nr:phosphorylase [Methylococcales bacterium]
MIIGIIVALPDEIDSLTNKKVNKGDCVFINDKTLLTCSGAGSKNAEKASQLLIKKGAKRLISWGCAAALKATLNPGDLMLPKTLITEKQETISIDSAWLNHTIDQLSPFVPQTGLLAESHFIVAASLDKQSINSHSGAIALDMESIAIAQVAIQHNCPVLVIRSIADPVSMSLPKAVSYALNEYGDVILTKLLWFLLTHPTELPGLIKLGLHFKAAKNKLKLISNQLDTIVGFEQKTVTK